MYLAVTPLVLRQSLEAFGINPHAFYVLFSIVQDSCASARAARSFSVRLPLVSALKAVRTAGRCSLRPLCRFSGTEHDTDNWQVENSWGRHSAGFFGTEVVRTTVRCRLQGWPPHVERRHHARNCCVRLAGSARWCADTAMWAWIALSLFVVWCSCVPHLRSAGAGSSALKVVQTTGRCKICGGIFGAESVTDWWQFGSALKVGTGCCVVENPCRTP